MNEEDKRWGPVSQTGEYAFDIPHFFGTRRTGPDLHREGGLRPDDWHAAHFFNPRWTVPASVMPALPLAVLRRAPLRQGARGRWRCSTRTATASSRRRSATTAPTRPTPCATLRRLVSSQDRATRLDMRGVRPPSRAGEAAPDPMLYVETEDTADGLVTSYDAGPRPTDECVDLIGYMQRLGTSIGAWRPVAYAPTPNRASPFDDVDPRPRQSPAMRAYGFLRQDAAKAKAADDALAAWKKAAKAWDAEHPILAQRLVKGGELFTKHCAGCHGAEGRGNGLAARDHARAPARLHARPVPLPQHARGLPPDGRRPLPHAAPRPAGLLDARVQGAGRRAAVAAGRLREVAVRGRQAVQRARPGGADEPAALRPLARQGARARPRALPHAASATTATACEGRGDGPGWADTGSDYGGRLRPRDLRPRLRPEDGPEVYGLLGRHLERFFGKEAWKGLSEGAGWKGLAPTDAAKQKDFMLFLLGEKGRLVTRARRGGGPEGAGRPVQEALRARPRPARGHPHGLRHGEGQARPALPRRRGPGRPLPDDHDRASTARP